MKLLKIGGSVITDKSGYKKSAADRIESMADAVAELWRRGERDLIIVHGAGSFGHALVLEHKIDDGVSTDEQKLGFAKTHSACSELSLLLVGALLERGVPAISLPPGALIRSSGKRIEEFRDDAVYSYLSQGYLPILHGDMVPDEALGGSVCSGDQIMAWLGRKAEFLVLATDVDGVLDGEGALIPEINKGNLEDVERHLKETSNDVTGAMKGKIRELLGLPVPSYIVNAASPDRIIDIICGKEARSTKINPKG